MAPVLTLLASEIVAVIVRLVVLQASVVNAIASIAGEVISKKIPFCSQAPISGVAVVPGQPPPGQRTVVPE